jgi:hypothetical protein
MKSQTLPSRVIVNAIALFFLLGSSSISANESAQANSQYAVVQDENGKSWFTDPEGNRFLSIGINNIVPDSWNPTPGTDYYNAIEEVFNGDTKAWLKSVKEIMDRAGMNTVACWSRPITGDLPYHQTPILYLAGHEQSRCLAALRPNYEKEARAIVAEVLAEWPDQSRVIGYFLDNEMAWYGVSPWTVLKNDTLLEAAFRLEANDPARTATVDFLKNRYRGSTVAFAAAWHVELESWNDLSYELLRKSITPAALADRDAFTEHAAEKFFAISTKILNEMAPGKLNLGVRFAGHAPEPVVRVCGKYSDVISFNDYRFGESTDPDPGRIAQMYLWGGKKPLMVTEYSWRAAENQSGNPNTGGAGTVVKTQQERADRNTAYLEKLFEYPMIVGAHWFEWADQSPQGRFDGENSNYGVVDINHGTYETLINAMGEINTRLDDIHANSPMQSPTQLPEAQPVTFEPGQYPHRPPSLPLLYIDATVNPETWNASDASVELSGTPGESMYINLKAGEDWGGGISLTGPKKLRLNESSPASDLDGYSRIVIDAEAPEAMQFQVFLDEASVGEPGGLFRDTLGDDGESFASGIFFGKNKRHTYTVEIGTMTHRGDWGNQSGARRIDLTAAKGVAIYFPGLQGDHQMILYDVRLER